MKDFKGVGKNGASFLWIFFRLGEREGVGCEILLHSNLALLLYGGIDLKKRRWGVLKYFKCID